MVLEVWLWQFAKSPISISLLELLYRSVLPFTSRVLKEEAVLTASLCYSVIL